MIGKLIPAGTGLERYGSVKLTTDNKPAVEEVISVSEEDEEAVEGEVLEVSEDMETIEIAEETVEVTEE